MGAGYQGAWSLFGEWAASASAWLCLLVFAVLGVPGGVALGGAGARVSEGLQWCQSVACALGSESAAADVGFVPSASTGPLGFAEAQGRRRWTVPSPPPDSVRSPLFLQCLGPASRFPCPPASACPLMRDPQLLGLKFLPTSGSPSHACLCCGIRTLHTFTSSHLPLYCLQLTLCVAFLCMLGSPR